MNTNNQIEKALSQGYDFRPSDYVSRGWETFKDYAGHYIGFVILMIILSSIASFIPFLSQMYSLTVGAALGVGAAIFTYVVNTQKDERFESFFGGFKHILPLAVVTLITWLVLGLIVSPLLIMYYDTFIDIIDETSPEAMVEAFSSISINGVLVFAVFLMMIYASIVLRWAPYLVIFYDYSPIDAVKTSFQLVNKNLFGHIILLLLFILLLIIGFFALLVGLLAALPVMMVAEYYGFSEVTGLELSGIDEIDEIGLKDDYFR